MPILIVIFIVIGALLTGNSMVNPQVKSTATEEAPVETTFPPLTPTLTPLIQVTPTPYHNPKPQNETYKRQLMSDLMLRIAKRYVDLKNSALQANKWEKQFLQCINKAEQKCSEYAQPQQSGLYDQKPPPGQNPVGEPLPDITYYLSPQQQVQLCNGAKSVCSIYSDNFKAQVNSIASADQDITEFKNQLVEITKDCSVCISDYQAAMKKFDEFEENIRQSIK